MEDIQDLDKQRLDDILRKSNGVESEAIALAHTQCLLIKNPAKAFRRYLASIVVYGMDNRIGKEFLKRAAELGQNDAKQIILLERQVRDGEAAKKTLESVKGKIEEKYAGYHCAYEFGLF